MYLASKKGSELEPNSKPSGLKGQPEPTSIISSRLLSPALFQNPKINTLQRQVIIQKVGHNYGNQATLRLIKSLQKSPIIQRCGCNSGNTCACQGNNKAPIEQDQENSVSPELTLRARLDKDDVKPGNCGPGTSNPFCLPIPDTEAPCQPFLTEEQADSAFDTLSVEIPLLTAAATGCGEVKTVWEAYFAKTSKPFAFSDPSSCVVAAAKTDSEASQRANAAADGFLQNIIQNLPVILRGVQPNPFPLDNHLAVIRIPLDEAVGPHGPQFLHPDIVFNTPTNAAANIAGAVGRNGEGSDIFGDDDREMTGTVVIEVDALDPETGGMVGQVRYVPHVHVKDTVDFCPGNLGNSVQKQFTIPLSKLEASNLTRDVPITIDYDLELRQSKFNALPLFGPLPPKPGTTPPDPTPDKFPRSGPAKTTGSLLRIRTGPSINATVLGLLGETGSPLQVKTQVHGDSVDGNDKWDQIEQGFVSDRFVSFDNQTE